MVSPAALVFFGGNVRAVRAGASHAPTLTPTPSMLVVDEWISCASPSDAVSNMLLWLRTFLDQFLKRHTDTTTEFSKSADAQAAAKVMQTKLIDCVVDLITGNE